MVTTNRISTPVGPMLAGVTKEGLCFLEFTGRHRLKTQLEKIKKRLKCRISSGTNPLFHEVQGQLNEYFDGTRRFFSLPLHVIGTTFQCHAWRGLEKIPYGKTRSYKEQAAFLNQPSATRAVAKANADNRISIIIPCHRLIGKNGGLIGYGGGLWRKEYLLDHERRYSI